MDNKKIAEILFKLHMDDLKDAEMLADYAKCVSDAGDASIASALYARSKTRLNQASECERHIASVMERMQEEAAAMGEAYDPNAIYTDMYNNWIDTWTDKVKRKLEAM